MRYTTRYTDAAAATVAIDINESVYIIILYGGACILLLYVYNMQKKDTSLGKNLSLSLSLSSLSLPSHVSRVIYIYI